MRHLFLLGSIFVAVVASVACSATSETPPSDAIDGGAPSTGDSSAPSAPADPGGDVPPPNTSGAGAGTGAKTGLPCDVQQLLENRCIGCHSGSSPPPLLTYSNLTALSASSPGKTMAQASLDRLKSTTNPMPPPPAVAPDASEMATFEAWLQAGTPMGTTCTDGASGADPGEPSDAGGARDGGAATPSVCTSKVTWTRGDQESPNMRPGGACLTCHQQRGGPRFDVAGTVYATAHEPNDCNGKAPPPALTVVVTDKNRKVTRIPVNAAGNFMTGAKIVAPFTVAVTDGTKIRAMTGTLTAGDCNSCHTEAGANGAPGRIMAP